MNAKSLKDLIFEKDMTIPKMADQLGLNKSTLYRKLADYRKLTVCEVRKIKEILDLSDSEAIDIFLKE